MGSLKRQAAKAERYVRCAKKCAHGCASYSPAALRRWMRNSPSSRRRLRRWRRRSMSRPARRSRWKPSRPRALTRGYELEASAKEATTRANQSALELERAVQRRRLQRRAHCGTGSAQRSRNRGAEQAKQHLQGLTASANRNAAFSKQRLRKLQPSASRRSYASRRRRPPLAR